MLLLPLQRVINFDPSDLAAKLEAYGRIAAAIGVLFCSLSTFCSALANKLPHADAFLHWPRVRRAYSYFAKGVAYLALNVSHRLLTVHRQAPAPPCPPINPLPEPPNA